MEHTVLTTVSNRQYEDDIDLLRYGRFLASYWVVLLASAVAGALGAFALASLLLPARFQSTATMSMTPSGTPTALVLNTTTAKPSLTNLTVVSETIKELGLDRDGVTLQGFVDGALEIRPVPATNLVKISVTLPDPTKARLAATLIAEKLIESTRRIELTGAAAVDKALKQMVVDADLSLKKAREQLLAFQMSAEIETLEAGIKSKLEREGGDGIEIGLVSERARLASLEQDLARRTSERRNAPGTGAANPVADPVHKTLQNDIAQSRAKIASLEQQQRQAIGTPRGAAVTSLRAELYRRRLELARLYATYDAYARSYNDLTLRAEALAKTNSPPQLQIVDAPVQPDQPLSRRRAQFGIFGGLVGMLFGVVAALLINKRRADLPAHV